MNVAVRNARCLQDGPTPRPPSGAALHGVFEDVAVVTQELGPHTCVRSSTGEWMAERASSCLVPPQRGDEVLLAFAPDGRTFILAVLRRRNSAVTEIAVAGDMHISAAGGSCEIEGVGGVGIRSAAGVSVSAKTFLLRAAETSLVVGKLTALAAGLLARVQSATLFAASLDSFFDRLSATAKSCFRKIEGTDELRARRIDYRTENEICLRGEHILAGARKLAKVDGEQIHIG